MNIIKNIIKIFLNDLALNQRKHLINKSEIKIEKLRLKLNTEENYHTELLKNALKLCEEIRINTDKYIS